MIEVAKIVKQLESTSSSNDKIAIIKQHSDNEVFKNVLKYTYDSNLNYGFSESNLRKLLDNTKSEDILENTWQNGFDMLNILATSNINDALRRNVITFLWCQLSEVRELFIRILTKDLRCNISSKTINKAIPKLIPTFEVMLAENYFKQKEGFLNGRDFMLSTKLDGHRMCAIKENNIVRFYTRQGQLIEGLIDIEEEFKDVPNGIVLDGELLLKNDNNLNSDELYRATTKIARKSGVKQNLQFHVFDCINLKSFRSGVDKTPYRDRRNRLKNIVADKVWLIEVPVLYSGNDEDMILHFLNEAKNSNEEGIMLNLSDGLYECKRSKNILKVKVFTDGDMRCVDIIEGTGKNAGKLGSITVEFEHEGRLHRCNCGSGFLDHERAIYFNNPELILNKIVTIEYFEISKNKQGGVGLRFPTWTSRITDKTEISMH